MLCLRTYGARQQKGCNQLLHINVKYYSNIETVCKNNKIFRRGYIGHAGIHVTGAYGMSYCLFLFQHGFVRLQIAVLACCSAAHVEEELGLVEIFLISRRGIKTHQCSGPDPLCGCFGFIVRAV